MEICLQNTNAGPQLLYSFSESINNDTTYRIKNLKLCYLSIIEIYIIADNPM